jgi:hypothetical protein
MRWIGGTMDSDVAKHIAALDRGINDYQNRNRLLDQQLSDLTAKLTAHTLNHKELNYLLEDDLFQILGNL